MKTDFLASMIVLSHIGSEKFVFAKFGGDKRDRTADPLLAKQVLSQLSYIPVSPGSESLLKGPSKLNNDYLISIPSIPDLGLNESFSIHSCSIERR